MGLIEIQQRLGHTDIQTPMNFYAHTTDYMKEKASQQFNKLMEDLHYKNIYMLGEHPFLNPR
ncbi:hypothetical protein [Peribacillus sp. R9-11]|uniref:hypothetical protein n=1 Tax=Peribacillus sp. R9-11 TaxID=3073271 RepID=UPI0028692E9E|nr:hypothetical protein [Peribacillus sp. R9-11]WMX56009.1 hypothetical protein RE409_01735 [Peribacillus sp. R9-11]